MKYKIIKGTSEEVQEKVNTMLKNGCKIKGELISISKDDFAQVLIEPTISSRDIASIFKIFVIVIFLLYIIISLSSVGFNIIEWSTSNLVGFGVLSAMVTIGIIPLAITSNID